MKRIAILGMLVPLTALGDTSAEGTAWVSESPNEVIAIQLVNERECAFAAIEKPKLTGLMAECTFSSDDRGLFVRFPIGMLPKGPGNLALAYDARSDTMSLPSGRTFRHTTRSEAQTLLGRQ